ncbi:MAG: glycosyltransferase family 4 protein [Desulfobulbaceae bacterium]|nr:glycosyltransferase family 4 protein [Desulfobulbaceae bacterium]HIJ77962.1 glycosyltransferase family 4 protein [Deltaproteobacteria bacterium]
MPCKKIAIVVPKYGLVGGGEQFVFELTERLAKYSGNDIHVFANKWQSSSTKITFHKIPIITFPKWLTTISFAYFVQCALKKFQPDIIHTHDRIFEADIATVHSIPHPLWVSEIRKKKSPSLFDRATSWVEKKLYLSDRCRLFMPVSELAAEMIKDFYSLPVTKLQVLPPGIDIDRFHKRDDVVRKSLRHEFGIKSHETLFLFVGMNFELKGLAILIKALARIQPRLKQGAIRLLVVGKGNREKFQAMAEAVGLGSKVVFAGVRNDMEKVYQAADAFVMLSGFDTFGMVVTEAMASGLPVVISDRVGAKDLVVDGENGFVVDRNNDDGIDSALIQLIDPLKNKYMSEKSRESIQVYSWDKLAQKIMDIYNNILL